MFSHSLKSVLLAVVLLGGANVCAAKNWTVTVGGSQTYDGGYGGSYTTPILQFSPRNLTITAGDTVTFVNAGGAQHNVHADDNSFRCAAGCDDAGGNGAISDGDWTFVRTFNTAGVVKYHCDEHASMGMTGTITVNAAAVTGMPISTTTSGSWYNPQQSGHGFLLQVAPGNTFVAYWFVYTPEGPAQAWVLGVGSYDPASNTVTIPAAQSTGAKFPPNFNHDDVTQTDWGTLTFTFTDCTNGTMSWTSKLPAYGSGSMPITKLAEVDGLHCGG
jgi:plastocyanin